MRIGLVAPLIAGVVLIARSSAACGQTLPSHLTLTGSLPAEGDVAVVRDLGVVLGAKPWANYPCKVGAPTLAIRVLEADSGKEVPGTQSVWLGEASLAWHPLVPLTANTGYVVHGSIVTLEPPPPEVVGPLELDAHFTTGSALAAPLELEGAITVELVPEEVPVQQCDCGPCGNCSNCVTTGTVPGVSARVQIPPVHGGYDKAGYQSWTYLTDNAPATFNGPGEAVQEGVTVNLLSYQELTPGQPAMVTFHVPDEATAYRPCFSVNVWDPAAQAASPPPVCLELMVPSKSVTGRDPPKDEPSSGCAFSPRRPVQRGAPWLLGLLLALLASGRRGTLRHSSRL